MPGLDPPEFLKNTGQDYPEPPDIDMTKPSIARVYSYYLGGKDHFEVDRTMANYAEGVVPGVTDLALGNRAFVQRAARLLASNDIGMDQFLDIGSGLPSDGNVHDIVHEKNSRATIVYVDNDPIVLAHARALLADDHSTSVVTADFNEPAEVLKEAALTGLIDFERPVGLMLGGIVHHIENRYDPLGSMRAYLAALAPGSHVAISHFCRPDPAHAAKSAQRAADLERAFIDKLSTGRWRTPGEIADYFGDWTLLPPGLVPLNDWHPLPSGSPVPGAYLMPPRNRSIIIGGVARKP